MGNSAWIAKVKTGGRSLKRMRMVGAILALVIVAAVPAIAQLASGVGQSPESGDVAPSIGVANEGDYASQCTPLIQEGNTGNFDNASSFIQSPAQAGGTQPGLAQYGETFDNAAGFAQPGFAQYAPGFAQYAAGLAQYSETFDNAAGFAQYDGETLRSSSHLRRPVSSPSTGSVVDDFEPGGIEVGIGGSLAAECPSTVQQSSAASAY
jgi:hypothetical protein